MMERCINCNHIINLILLLETLAVTPILQVNLYHECIVACFLLHVYQLIIGFCDCFKSTTPSTVF